VIIATSTITANDPVTGKNRGDLTVILERQIIQRRLDGLYGGDPSRVDLNKPPELYSTSPHPFRSATFPHGVPCQGYFDPYYCI
jgi:hypothetical protein